jgi:adenosine deaminase
MARFWMMGAIGLALLASGPALAQSASEQEAAAARLFDTLVAQPPRLRVFLKAMPKGADLHNHLWGTPYAEEFIAWGAAGGLCLRLADSTFVPPPCADPASVPLAGLSSRDPGLYDRTIDALSTRAHARGVGRNDVTGHGQFFASFDKFAAAAIPAIGPMLASARDKAAGDHVQYLELMSNPGAVHLLAAKASETPWDGDFAAALRRIQPLLPQYVGDARAETDKAEAEAAAINGCGSVLAPDACYVTVRYLPFALRSQPPAYVFGQMAIAFALVAADPRYVGVNIVAPEDGPVATADYDLHMKMFAFFHARYPKVPLALHAGEVTLGLVPPAELRGRIRKAVEIAGASRIGHGVDISYEDDAAGLLKKMAAKNVAVEINLTSNDTILGVKGKDHPLALYRAAGVPVVLSTDDEGVSRSDMTNEYLRAAIEQGLDYRALKAIVWTGIRHSFLGPADKLREMATLERSFGEFEAKIVAAKF